MTDLNFRPLPVMNTCGINILIEYFEKDFSENQIALHNYFMENGIYDIKSDPLKQLFPNRFDRSLPTLFKPYRADAEVTVENSGV